MMIVRNENTYVVNLGGDLVIAPLATVEVEKDNDFAKRAVTSGLLAEVKKPKK